MQAEAITLTSFMKALDELGRFVLGETDPRQLAKIASSVIRHCLRLPYVALVRVDHEKELLEYLGHAADVEPGLKPGDTQPMSKGLVGLCAREGRTVYVSDVRSDPNYVEIIEGVTCEISAPVIAGDTVVAVLNCEARDNQALKNARTFIEIAANRLGAAFENARLLRERALAHEREKEHARELELLNEIARIATQDLELRPMLQRITDAIARGFSWEFVVLATGDHETNRFTIEAVTSSVPTGITVGYGRALGSGVVGEVLLTGKARDIPDVSKAENYVDTWPGCQSELCVPVKSNGTTIAVLNLESARLDGFAGQRQLLETVADQIAGAIANAQAFGQLKRQARHLGMLSELSRLALEAERLQDVLDRVVDYIESHLEFPFVALLLYDEGEDSLELAASAGPLPVSIAKGKRWPVGAGIVGRAVRTGLPQLVEDVSKDKDYVAINPDVTCELVMPIRFKNRTLGVINIEGTRRGSFNIATRQLLQTFVDQIAGEIHLANVNAQLAQANAKMAEILERKRTRPIRKTERLK